MIALVAVALALLVGIGIGAALATRHEAETVSLNADMAKFVNRVVHWNDTLAPSELVHVMPDEFINRGERLLSEYRRQLKRGQ